jgi:hypothetical protein
MKTHKLTFPQELYELVQLKTQKLGLSVPEYVRHLIINDVESMTVEEASPQLEEKIANGLRDIAEGKYIVIKDKEELKKFVEDL